MSEAGVRSPEIVNYIWYMCARRRVIVAGDVNKWSKRYRRVVN